MGLTEATKTNLNEKETISIGEEFLRWAEEFWHIDDLINKNNTDPDNFNGEVCDYTYMRKIFISKIDSILIERLDLNKK